MNEIGLDDLRNSLDSIDNQLLKLLNDRMELVHQVGILKAKNGTSIYRPEREHAIIKRLNSLSKGRLSSSAIKSLFLEIFAISRNLELPQNIAYLGPEGTFTHQAAQNRFGTMSSYLPIGSIKGVFEEVSSKKAKYGVIPIENSSNGIVSDTISCLNTYNVKVIAEVIIDIHHTLSTTCEDIKDIKTIYSKDIAFEQCGIFLENLGLDECEYIPVESTAKAARYALNNINSAAICSHVASKMSNLPILFENIEDKHNNKTRFFVISDFENVQSGNDKTSILVKLPNSPGSLVEFLTDFEKFGLNLTKIKSHIVEGDSIFFIDFDGHKDDDKVKTIFSKHKRSIKFLGSYVKEIDDI
jgi:chorismate mutase / prephenate dehydratase